MAFRLQPIRPKRPVTRVNPRKVVAEMLKAGVGFTEDLSKYPPARTPYRRTGRLGGGWTLIPPRAEGSKLVTGTGNKVVYAGFVQGYRRRRPRQRRVFSGYGWPNVEDVGKRVWKARRPHVVAALQGR